MLSQNISGETYPKSIFLNNKLIKQLLLLGKYGSARATAYLSSNYCFTKTQESSASLKVA
jgi:hypothetical protein